VRALALARDDGHGLCRNAAVLCNIVYEKDPAKGDIGQARAPAGCWSAHRRRFIGAKKTGSATVTKTFLIT